MQKTKFNVLISLNVSAVESGSSLPDYSLSGYSKIYRQNRMHLSQCPNVQVCLGDRCSPGADPQEVRGARSNPRLTQNFSFRNFEFDDVLISYLPL